ncbi:MAG TPA: hypothetical protein VIM08_04100 [Arthrobacter sp.]
MNQQRPNFSLELTAEDPKAIDRDLNAAVEIALQHAMHSRQGILVTQHGYNNYTVALSREVPPGEIREQRN